MHPPDAVAEELDRVEGRTHAVEYQVRRVEVHPRVRGAEVTERPREGGRGLLARLEEKALPVPLEALEEFSQRREKPAVEGARRVVGDEADVSDVVAHAGGRGEIGEGDRVGQARPAELLGHEAARRRAPGQVALLSAEHLEECAHTHPRRVGGVTDARGIAGALEAFERRRYLAGRYPDLRDAGEYRCGVAPAQAQAHYQPQIESRQ